MTNTEGVSKSSTPITKLHFPQPWLEERERFELIQQLEVRKVSNSTADEYFFAALPDGDWDYSYEVDASKPKPRYGKNAYAVNFAASSKVRATTNNEWESASRIVTKSRYVFHVGSDYSVGDIEYKHKSYPKVGKYWGQGWLSPTGRWLAVFSYNGEKPPPEFIHFITGGDPPEGDIFWQIYDTVHGQKVFEWEARNVKSPTTLDGPVVWLEDRYFLFPEDQTVQTLNVVTLPPLTPEVNPVTIQLPSRRDANGRALPAPDRHEVWGELAGMSKEQLANLTVPFETEITEFRLAGQQNSKELLFAIREETENRRINRPQRGGVRGYGDAGGGEYNYRLLSTYYFAVSFDDPTQTRFASKEEWERGKVLRSVVAKVSENDATETSTDAVSPKRQFAKTGTTLGSPQTLNAGEWIAVFSYSPEAGRRAEGKMFVDVYDRISRNKLLSTELPYRIPPNELFKGATWIDGDYMLLPLNTSLDSFAFWKLP